MASPQQSLQVESADVIKLMLQFCAEHKLHASLRALQEETSVTLNVVDSVERFVADVQQGRWESVLAVSSSLTLPTAKLLDLYEQIVLELAEQREIDTARALLRQAPPLANTMKKEHPERYLFLEHILTRTASHAFDAAAAYPDGGSKEKRRNAIALALQDEVQSVPPSRLLTLLTQSLKYQQLQGLLPRGSRYDLFRGGAPVDASSSGAGAAAAFPTRNSKVIKFGAKSYPECARFSPDGQWLASGSCDGYVEIWEADTGKLSSEHAYQTRDELMSHDSAVLCLTFNLGMELLATGAARGDVKVWRLATGSCVRKFPTAHAAGVSSLEFVRDGTQLLSCSQDTTLKLHGLKSGRTLKEFRGHASFVNGATFTSDQTHIVSASADGTMRVWDVKTCDCIKTIRMAPAPGSGSIATPPPLLAVHLIPPDAAHPHDRFVLVERSGTLRVLSSEGAVLHSFLSTSSASSSSGAAVAGALASEKDKAAAAASARAQRLGLTSGVHPGDFVAACVSARRGGGTGANGGLLYGVTEECVLHCFDLASGKLVHAIKLHRADVLGVTHHPHNNLLASWAQEGTIKLWKP